MGMQSDRPDNPPLPLVRNEKVLEQPDQRGITERYGRSGQLHRPTQGRALLFVSGHVRSRALICAQAIFRILKNGAYGGAVECIDGVLALSWIDSRS